MININKEYKYLQSYRQLFTLKKYELGINSFTTPNMLEIVDRLKKNKEIFPLFIIYSDNNSKILFKALLQA